MTKQAIIHRENGDVAFEDAMGSNENAAKFYRRLKEAETELYENCPIGVTDLSFAIELLNLKQTNNWTNKSITEMLKFLRKIFPATKIPKSYYQANKLTSDLGFKYETWDACPNNCTLFRNETAHLEHCEICGASRYKSSSTSQGTTEGAVHPQLGKKVAEKQVLQRLFGSSHTALLMKWHSEERINDGVMRHPADSPAWKKLEVLMVINFNCFA